MRLLDWELQRIPWAALRAAADPNRIPRALLTLADATTEATAMEAYWHIDNVAVVQARVFQAAEFVVFPLLLMLRPSSSLWTVRCVLDLLVQLTSGWVDPSEVEINHGLLDRVRNQARFGLSAIYTLLRSDDSYTRDRAIEVLDAIELDRNRLTFVLKRIATVETDPNVRALALRVAEGETG